MLDRDGLQIVGSRPAVAILYQVGARQIDSVGTQVQAFRPFGNISRFPWRTGFDEPRITVFVNIPVLHWTPKLKPFDTIRLGLTLIKGPPALQEIGRASWRKRVGQY